MCVYVGVCVWMCGCVCVSEALVSVGVCVGEGLVSVCG